MQQIFFIFACILTSFVCCLGTLAKADEIRVAFGISLPPYIISAQDAGIEFDIIKEALSYKGHTMTPVYMPFIEVRGAIVEGRADAAATVKHTVGIEGKYSDNVIRYQNFAISRADKHLTAESIEDLSDKKVVAFQLATKYLGNAFAKMAQNNPFYRERTDQIKQVTLLLSGKVDFAIADKNIFLYYQKNLAKELRETEVLYHDIFPPNDYEVVFKDASHRDDFNAGLAALKASGRYEAIISSYIEH